MARLKQSLRSKKGVKSAPGGRRVKGETTRAIRALYLTDMPDLGLQKWNEVMTSSADKHRHHLITGRGMLSGTEVVVVLDDACVCCDDDHFVACDYDYFVAYIKALVPKDGARGYELKVFRFSPEELSPSAFATWFKYQFVEKAKRATFRGALSWRALFSDDQYELLTGKSAEYQRQKSHKRGPTRRDDEGEEDEDDEDVEDEEDEEDEDMEDMEDEEDVEDAPRSDEKPEQKPKQKRRGDRGGRDAKRTISINIRDAREGDAVEVEEVEEVVHPCDDAQPPRKASRGRNVSPSVSISCDTSGEAPLQAPLPQPSSGFIGRDLSSLLMAAQRQVEDAHKLSQLVFNVLEANKKLEEWCNTQ